MRSGKVISRQKAVEQTNGVGGRQSSTRRSLPSFLTVIAILFALAPLGRAQNLASDVAALQKQRAALCLQASHTPLADLEGDVNHLAVLSESCRIQYGAKACGLTEKPLESDKPEERYAYYIRRPVEAHASVQIKIDKHNWGGSTARASR